MGDSMGGQFFLGVLAHERDPQIPPGSGSPDRQLKPVDVREWIGGRGQLEFRRGEDKVRQKKMNGAVMPGAHFQCLGTAGGPQHDKAGFFKERSTQLSVSRFVADEKNRAGRGRRFG